MYLLGYERFLLNRGSAIADLSVKLVVPLGEPRLLQSVPLQDHLFVGIHRSLCVIRMIARLVAAGLIG